MLNISPYYSPDGLIKLDYADILNAQKLKVIQEIETNDLSTKTIESETIETETENTTTSNIQNANITNLNVTSEENINIQTTQVLALNGTIMINNNYLTASAHQLNYNDISEEGIAFNNKALILDENKDITGINNIGSTNGIFTNISGTLTTSSQPNITTLGTLTALNCTGNISGTLTTSSQPNITTLGTLTALNCTGNISGTLTTSSQPNITTLGTLTALNCTGNISGTLTTSSQPNITTLGTLTTLNVNSTGVISLECSRLSVKSNIEPNGIYNLGNSTSKFNILYCSQVGGSSIIDYVTNGYFNNLSVINLTFQNVPSITTTGTITINQNDLIRQDKIILSSTYGSIIRGNGNSIEICSGHAYSFMNGEISFRTNDGDGNYTPRFTIRSNLIWLNVDLLPVYTNTLNLGSSTIYYNGSYINNMYSTNINTTNINATNVGTTGSHITTSYIDTVNSTNINATNYYGSNVGTSDSHITSSYIDYVYNNMIDTANLRGQSTGSIIKLYNSIVPNSSLSLNIGSTGYLFNYLYTKNINSNSENLTIGTTNQIILDCSQYKFTGLLVSSIIPYNNNFNLGSTENKFINGYINNIYGTIQTNNQPNITILGTLTNINVNSSSAMSLTSSGSATLQGSYLYLGASTDTGFNSINLTSNYGGISLYSASGKDIKFDSGASILTKGNIQPLTTNLYYLGNLSYQYEGLCTRNVSSSSYLVLTSSAGMAINSGSYLELRGSYIAHNCNFRGWVDGTQNLGELGLRYNAIYVNNISSGSNMLNITCGKFNITPSKDIYIIQSKNIDYSGTVNFSDPTGITLSATYSTVNKLWTQYIDSYYNCVFCYSSGGDAYEDKGWISRDASNQMNFTGQHHCINDETFIIDDINNYIGLIVVTTGKYNTCDKEGKPQTGKHAITINNSLPVVKLSSSRKQKSVFGVISNMEEGNKRAYAIGNFNSVFPKTEGDDRLYINGVGEGAIYIVNTNGNLSNGDYVQTSFITGYGEKQDDDIYHNYTVCKITCDCDFDLNSDIYECSEFVYNYVTYRKAFVGCIYLSG